MDRTTALGYVLSLLVGVFPVLVPKYRAEVAWGIYTLAVAILFATARHQSSVTTPLRQFFSFVDRQSNKLRRIKRGFTDDVQVLKKALQYLAQWLDETGTGIGEALGDKAEAGFRKRRVPDYMVLYPNSRANFDKYVDEMCVFLAQYKLVVRTADLVPTFHPGNFPK